jgi:hypothetical protein
MSLRTVGVILLLIGSLALGIGFGELSFRLFVSVMPPAAVSGFSNGSAHVMYILYGAGFGLAMFLYALLAVALTPVFRKRTSASAATTTTP